MTNFDHSALQKWPAVDPGYNASLHKNLHAALPGPLEFCSELAHSVRNYSLEYMVLMFAEKTFFFTCA